MIAFGEPQFTVLLKSLFLSLETDKAKKKWMQMVNGKVPSLIKTDQMQRNFPGKTEPRGSQFSGARDYESC